MKTKIITYGITCLCMVWLNSQLLWAQFSLDVETGASIISRNDASSSWKNSSGDLNGADGTLYSYVKDFENKPKPIVRLRLLYTFGKQKRHVLSVLAAPLQYRATGSFAQPVVFNSQNFAANTPTEGFYKFSGYRITYRYLLKNTAKLTLGVGVTLNVRDAEFSLKQGNLYERNYNFGTVPLLNTYVKYSFAPKLAGLVDGDIFYIDNTGGALDFLGGFQYALTDKIGLKAGYRIFSGVGSEKGNVYNKLTANSAILGVVATF